MFCSWFQLPCSSSSLHFLLFECPVFLPLSHPSIFLFLSFFVCFWSSVYQFFPFPSFFASHLSVCPSSPLSEVSSVFWAESWGVLGESRQSGAVFLYAVCSGGRNADRRLLIALIALLLFRDGMQMFRLRRVLHGVCNLPSDLTVIYSNEQWRIT